jgi:predicted CXXCH cytochrome family protein
MRQNDCCRLLLVLLLALALAGCSARSRYKVLTFFFTGVPPYGTKAVVPPTAAELAQAERAKLLLKKQRRLAVIKKFTGDWAHGPFAARLCEDCHIMSTFGSFGNGHSLAYPKSTIRPGKFVMPIAKLCVSCHSSKSAALVQAAGLRLHGPVAHNCTYCHSPHHTNERYMLKARPNKLCVQCHAPGFIFTTALHAGKTNCLKCHNPHTGRNAKMLRDDFQETF